MTDRPITVPVDTSTSTLADSAASRARGLSSALCRYVTLTGAEQAEQTAIALIAEAKLLRVHARQLVAAAKAQARAAERERAA